MKIPLGGAVGPAPKRAGAARHRVAVGAGGCGVGRWWRRGW